MYLFLIFYVLLLQHIDTNHICIQQDFPRVRKFEGKPFILFPTLASLYEGSSNIFTLHFLYSLVFVHMHVVLLHIDLAFLVLLLSRPGSIATGDLHFLSIPHIDITSKDVSPTNSSSSHLGTLNPLSSNLDGG